MTTLPGSLCRAAARGLISCATGGFDEEVIVISCEGCVGR